MAEAREKIWAMIGAIRRCWLRRELSLLAMILCIGLLVWLTVMVWLDNTLMLSTRGLLSGWFVLAVVIVAAAVLAAYRLTIAKPAPRQLAMEFEARVPQQENRLVNSIDFLSSEKIEQDAMARAAVVENSLRLDAALAPQAIDWRNVKAMLITAAACLLVLLTYSAFRASYVANAIERLFDPLNPAPHILLTDINVSPGNAHLIEGDSLPIQAKLDRHLPGSAQVEYRMDNGGWTRADMLGSDAKTFHYDGLKNVWQDFQYRIVAGRSVSKTYSVTVTPRPKVQSVQVIVTPPAYTGAPEKTLPKDQGDVTALAGSKIQINVTGSTILSAAHLELSDSQQIPLTTSRSTASGSFVMKTSGSYAVVIADANKLSNLSPPRYAMTIQEDQPPNAIFSEPGRDLIMPADATVNLKLDAEDDWGLVAIAIQTKTTTGDWKTIAHAELAAPGEKHKSLTAQLKLADYQLKSGDTLLYRATASDHCQPTANTYIGRPWSIAVGSSTGDAPLLAAEAKKVLESLQAILALQKEARGDVDSDREVPPIREKQTRVRDLTLAAIEQQRQSIRPMANVIADLSTLASGPMVQASQLLADFGGSYQVRVPKKPPILKVQDQIIAKLEELIGKVNKSVELADKAQTALEKLSPEQKEQALKQVRDMLEKLRNFIPEQDKLIDDTKELERKAPNYTKDDLQKIDQLKGTEDSWDKVFAGSVDDINKLLQQGFADSTIADDYKQMVEQIADAAKDLNPQIKTTVVPREQTALELATQLKQDMEMWLPNTPDDTKWVMEEPLSMPDVPMPPLPANLSDLIGDLMQQEQQDMDAAADQTSSWADSMSAAGWGASDGPISNFSAKGVTGNQMPNNDEMTGRAGDGRAGKSDGQMVSDVAKGLDGQKTPTRVTNDAYEQGVVKELQQTPTGGATGGGKARGSGQEGLQGASPPPSFDKMPFMKDWQQRIRQKAERLAGQLNSVHLHLQDLDKSIEAMKQAEQAAKEGRYADMFKAQQMVLQQLQSAENLAAKDAAMHVDRAFNLPPDRRPTVLDAGDEPVPSEYHGAVQRYFEQLSNDPR